MSSSESHEFTLSPDYLRYVGTESSISSYVNESKVSELIIESKNQERYEKEFKEVSILGTGGFGVVYRATHYLDKQDYAIKRIALSMNSNLENNLALREVNVMCKLSHPSVARYHCSWIQPFEEDIDSDVDKLYLCDSDSSFNNQDNSEEISTSSSITFKSDNLRIFPYLEGKTTSNLSFGLFIQMQLGKENLRDWLFNRNEKELQEKSLWLQKDIIQHLNIFKDISAGVDYLHLNKIIHRDIKPANIIFHQDLRSVFLTDFGLSKVIEDSEVYSNIYQQCNDHPIGTPIYAAPEMKTKNYDSKVDIFSLGIVLMELVYPFSCMSERAKVLQNLKSNNIVDVKIRNDWKSVVDAILWMTNHNPIKRPDSSTLHKLVTSSFVQFSKQMNEMIQKNEPFRAISFCQSETLKKRKILRSKIVKLRRNTSQSSYVFHNKKIICNSCKSNKQKNINNLWEKLSKMEYEIKEIKDKILEIKTIKEDFAQLNEIIINLIKCRL